MRRLAAPILVFEAVVLGLALPVAISVVGADPLVTSIGAGVLIAIALALTALLRYRWAYIVGSVLQVLIIACGAVVSVMYLLGALFAMLWVVALWLGRRTYVA